MIITDNFPTSPDWIAEVKEKAIYNMCNYDNCTQSILAAFMETLNIDNPLLLRAATPMLGGMTASLTCGIHSAAMMVLGLLMGRDNLAEGSDGLMPIVLPAQELIQQLNLLLGSHSCKELTGVDFTNRKEARKFRVSEGPKKCVERVGDGAELIAQFLYDLHQKGLLFRPAELVCRQVRLPQL